MPVAEQRRRMAELDTLRIDRPLTVQERAEAESLINRLYMREYRRRYAERGHERRRRQRACSERRDE